MNESQPKTQPTPRRFLSIPLSLRGKLIIGNMLITLLAILGMGYYVYYRAQESNNYLTTQLEQSISRSANDNLTAIANKRSTLLNSYFESRSHEIALVGANLNRLFSSESPLSNGIYWDAAQSLTLLPNGSWDNSNSEPSSIFIPAGFLELNPNLISQLNTIKLTETTIPSILETNPEIIAIYFGGRSGETIYYPNIDLANIVPADFDVTSRPWYVAAIPTNNPGRNVIWSDPYQDAALNGLIVTTSIPVFDVERNFRGVAAMDIQPNSLTDIVSNIRVGRSGYAFLIDHAGRLIAFPQSGYADFGVTPEDIPLGEVIDSTKLPNMPQSFFETLSKIAAGENGFTTIKINGVNRYMAYSPVSEVGYGLAILIPESELQADAVIAKAQIEQQTLNTILVSLILIFAILLTASMASLGMGNALTLPLTTLTKTAEKIAGGNLNARAEIQNQDEIGILGQALNTMASELRKSFVFLEQGVAERTYELEISRTQSERRANDLQAISEVSKVITGEQKLSVLLPLITRLVSERFGFYHTGIFLLDDANKYAVLQAANSEGGKIMLARGHKLEVGESGIVGYVGKFSTPRIALDVGLDAVFFNNPDLPDTRSEMALPLIVRNKIVGVLDIQSTKPGAFTAAELNTMSILADQVAIAIENARLFQQTQQALDEAEAIYRQNTLEGWKAFSKEESTVGYHQTLTGGNKLFTPLETEETRQVMNRGESMVFNASTASTEASIVIPIKLRGQVIGTLKVTAPEQDRSWSQDEVNLAETVSERLSLALENARLIQESQGQAAKEQIISDITSKIGTTVRTESILRTAAAELSQLLNDADIFIDLQPTTNNENGVE